ncbi:thiolase family protein [Desulfotignum balticum]|uniref:Putative acetyl-CoA acetyltransferase n=1 Tax=Desulfotignum balticum TaxID=115781 RepID=C4B7T3_9BACT|nr:thiolase family protein [Desulfotignum balticum]BAH60915.1 putative acetyl-CoA acetyltransferase [Desulfotignum balticum]
MKEIVIVGASRTAIGDFGGALKNVPPMDLARHVITSVLKRSNVQPGWIDKVMFGCAFSPVDQNIARNAAFKAGVPQEAPGFTINGTCGSSLQAIMSGVQSILCDECDVVLAGGVESMSNAPFIMDSARWGQRLRHLTAYDLVWKGMQEPSIGVGMGLTAENLAEKYEISREEQDEFALLSHQRAARAIKDKRFIEEITPYPIPSRKGQPVSFDTDEHVRSNATLEGMAKLPAIFKKGGTVTAGNACGMNDASSAIIITHREKADELGLKPLAKISAYHVAGVDPDYMGIGPVPAIQGVLAKSNFGVNDIDRYEINEAFAAQYLACEKVLGLDREKTNIYGNGIALGHPVGATGCRLVVTLLYQMQDQGLESGVASLCAGGGMGFAVLLEGVS